MGRTRSDRKLIHDRIKRNLNCIDESVRRLEEILGMLQEASHSDDDAYIEQQEEIAQMLVLWEGFRELHSKLYDAF